MMFAELDFEEFRLRIPFVCRMCGECCRKLSKVIYDPRTGKVYIEDLEFDYIEGVEEYKDFQHPIRIVCPFLKDNKCTIYQIRPKSCREYPLLTGDLGVNCPALKSFKRFLNAFKAKRVEFKVVEGELEPTCIPEEFLKIFKSLNPTKEELEAFMRLNKVEKSLNLVMTTKHKGP